jgi:hypothetical protein
LSNAVCFGGRLLASTHGTRNICGGAVWRTQLPVPTISLQKHAAAARGATACTAQSRETFQLLSPGGAFSSFWWRSGVSDKHCSLQLSDYRTPATSQPNYSGSGKVSFPRGCWPAAATDWTDKHPASSLPAKF